MTKETRHIRIDLDAHIKINVEKSKVGLTNSEVILCSDINLEKVKKLKLKKLNNKTK